MSSKVNSLLFKLSERFRCAVSKNPYFGLRGNTPRKRMTYLLGASVKVKRIVQYEPEESIVDSWAIVYCFGEWGRRLHGVLDVDNHELGSTSHNNRRLTIFGISSSLRGVNMIEGIFAPIFCSISACSI